MNQALPNGVYQFDHTVDSLCPMATRGLTGDLTNITAWGCQPNPTQQWELTSQGGNEYIIQNVFTKTFPTWNETYLNEALNGSHMVYVSLSATPNQQTWYIAQTPLSNGTYVISPNSNLDLNWSGVQPDPALTAGLTIGLYSADSPVDHSTGVYNAWAMNFIEPPVIQSIPATSSVISPTTSSMINPTTSSLISPVPTAMISQKVPSATSHVMIAVVSVASVLGISLLVFAWKQTHNLHYFFSSLVHALFGWAPFRQRSFRFSLADETIGPVEISLFLSPNDVIKDSKELLVWNVIEMGRSRSNLDCIIHCPVIPGTSNGQTKLGFAKVILNEKQHSLEVSLAELDKYAAAPAKWNGSHFERLEEVGNGPVLQLDGGVEEDFALGTYDESRNSFKPYFLIGNLQQGNNDYGEHSNLFLHALATTGYSSGQYGEDLVERFRGQILTPNSKGIKLTDLGPVSHWCIWKGKDGNLKLELKDKLKRKNMASEQGESHELATFIPSYPVSET